MADGTPTSSCDPGPGACFTGNSSYITVSQSGERPDLNPAVALWTGSDIRKTSGQMRDNRQRLVST
ncbi:hypothetical protein JOB18_030401 [Solea senegalensis]|uniref:Uncharacterized protein n=1 Tax=Solea senegalensis TaxID=28829 RepID=A0AAV6PLF1_SOLSE|nr:hypothetical protein JOB18_030401 [Solea senegalensis]